MMLKEVEVKDYFKRDGTVVNWWDPEASDMSHIYARQLDLVLKWLDKGEVKRVLDASCGKGRAIKRLHPTYHVTGVDISREMLGYVKGLELDRVDLVRADVDKLPFGSSAFDSVVCLEALVHYPDPRVALGEFRRVLRPHGLLVIDVDNENSLKRLVKKSGHKLSKLFERDFRPMSEGIFQAYTEPEFRGLIEENGFALQKIAHLGVLVSTNLHLPGDRKITIISRNFSESAVRLNKFLEEFPITRQLSTYTVALCERI